MLAMLALTLAPTVSHALAAARGAPAWVDICTLQGAQRVVIGDMAAGQESPGSTASHLEHCAYCSLASHAPALPSVVAAILPLQPSNAAAASHFRQAPRAPFAWRQAQPRAPPAPY